METGFLVGEVLFSLVLVKGLKQNEVCSSVQVSVAKHCKVAAMSVSFDFGMSGCPDDPDGNNCGKAISTQLSIAVVLADSRFCIDSSPTSPL